ncbi:hypothetical protein L1887_15279 [Cichorium endivia]|nr:hypothetical protein L1887_15279 [Cichorium endivia]
MNSNDSVSNVYSVLESKNAMIGVQMFVVHQQTKPFNEANNPFQYTLYSFLIISPVKANTDLMKMNYPTLPPLQIP